MKKQSNEHKIRMFKIINKTNNNSKFQNFSQIEQRRSNLIGVLHLFLL